MSAWTPRFLYRNRLHESGVTILASDEVATLPDDNLLTKDPSVAWRADTLTSLTLTADFNEVKSWDTFFLGYTNLTPKRNLSSDSNLLNGSPSAEWTFTNLAGSQTERPIARKQSLSFLLDAETSAGIHEFEQTFTPTLTLNPITSFVVSVYIDKDVPGTAAGGVRLYIDEGGSELSVDFDFSTGLSSVTSGAGWTLGTALATEATFGANTSTRVDLSGTRDSGAAMGNPDYGLRVLDSGGSESYTGGNEEAYVSQVQFEIGSAFSFAEEKVTDDVIGPLVSLTGKIGGSNNNVVYPFHGAAREQVDIQADTGWIHCATYASSSVLYDDLIVVSISDENNADTFVEGGVLMLGESLKPTGVLVSGNASHKGAMPAIRRTWEAGRWVYEIDFDYIDADTAEREFLDMYRYANKNDDGAESVRSAGGQRYSRRKGVLFIGDTGAGTSEPERTIYGELLGSLQITSTVAGKSRATIRLGEFPK